MPWTRNEPDPLKARKQQLAEQERQLAERMSRLNEELRNGGEPLAAGKNKVPEPPIWRLEEETSRRVPELASARRRNLARQRQRDMVVFFLCIVLLLVATGIFIWLWKVHLRPDQ